MQTKQFETISQRAVESYRRSLSDLRFVPHDDASSESQQALHGFMQSLYETLAESPDLFGLPAGADDAIAENEPNTKDKKQEVKRKLDKPRGMIYAGLEFLLLAGSQGVLEGNSLVVVGYPTLVKQSKIAKKFLQGMEAAGLRVVPTGDKVILSNDHFPTMMPAMKALAESCARFDPPHVGRFQFARCDFNALQGKGPRDIDLFRVFEGEEYEHVMQLHEYFSAKKYKTSVGINGQFGWVVQYQGDRKVKSSPLFQVDYDDRWARPLRMQIKCASTNRIADLLPGQSQKLRDDFMKRVFTCNGDKCGWCKNRKSLGPSVIEHNGERRTVCWYSNGDFSQIDDNSVKLIQEYEQMHARLGTE